MPLGLAGARGLARFFLLSPAAISFSSCSEEIVARSSLSSFRRLLFSLAESLKNATRPLACGRQLGSRAVCVSGLMQNLTLNITLSVTLIIDPGPDAPPDP